MPADSKRTGGTIGPLLAWLGVRLARPVTPVLSWPFLFSWIALLGIELGVFNSSRLLQPERPLQTKSYRG